MSLYSPIKSRKRVVATAVMTIDEQVDPQTSEPYLRVVTTDEQGNEIAERY